MQDYGLLSSAIRERVPGAELREQELLAPYTTFRIGGPCRLMICPHSADELQGVLKLLAEWGEKPLVIGCGSNLLFPDEGYEGTVIVTRKAFSSITCCEDGLIAADAGVTLSQLARFALDRGLTGLEFASGIPGSVGGAVFMNAGAYGGEISQVLADTLYIDENGEFQTISREAHRFSYRDSVFQHGNAVIVRSRFALSPGDPEEIRAKMSELAGKRKEKQPLEYPSAGSAFRRPEGGKYYAAALIDQAGLKGYRVGGAAVSEKHAGFVINLGGATAADVKTLLQDVRGTVYRNSGVLLEPEIRII